MKSSLIAIPEIELRPNRFVVVHEASVNLIILKVFHNKLISSFAVNLGTPCLHLFDRSLIIDASIAIEVFIFSKHSDLLIP